MNLLKEILENKRAEIERLKQDTSLEYLKSYASIRRQAPDFLSMFKDDRIDLIAEIKRRSPSAGVIRERLHPAHIAEAYESAGASALSILMDQKYFGGEESDFVLARDAVDVPILYKEFVIDCWQIWHAASLGATAVLLIAAALDQKELEFLMGCCASAHVEPLIEVHDAPEMKRVRELRGRCVGINNRDLKTFEVSLETTLRLRDQAPDGAVIISESGIRKADDVLRLKEAGVGGVLVGEHLLRQPDPAQAIRELMGPAWASS